MKKSFAFSTSHTKSLPVNVGALKQMTTTKSAILGEKKILQSQYKKRIMRYINVLAKKKGKMKKKSII